MTTANPYLEREIQAATPQKMRLMLIEGAIRFALMSKAHDERGESQLASAARGRCRAILAELLDSIDGEGEIADELRAVSCVTLTEYVATEAVNPPEAIDNLLGVLAIERDTWARVCEQEPTIPEEVQRHRQSSGDVTSARAAEILALDNKDRLTTSATNDEDDTHRPGFCIDA